VLGDSAKGHDGPITALESMGGRPQFLSASEDGTIRAWDVAKGEERYRMDGFTTDLSSLCVQGSGDSDDDLLITNGMNQYVCVHDFTMGLPNSIDDFLEPWDD
jgi:WD40 repeat protein